MKKYLRRICAVALAAALSASLCISASAFTYPSSYWPLHDQWDAISGGSDVGSITSVAQQTYDLLVPMGMCEDVCWNLEPKCATAAWACEVSGDIDGAITWLERQLTFAQWLHDNGYGYDDTLIDVNAHLDYLRTAQTPKIYAQSDNGPSPYGYGPASGTWFGTALGHEQPNESAALMYVTFQDGYSMDYWIDYYMNTSDNFRQAANGGVVELAWNFQPEGTGGAQTVLSSDSYINESLRAIGQLNATVLLRVGAEMNNWVECDANTFIQAFQKVANAAAAYPNIQMVFSPNDISNRNVTIEQFYPGDQYVDWIGVSTYQNTNYTDLNGAPMSYAYGGAAGSNPFYGTGVYDYDPLIVIQPVVELARAHGKPMMISECGFAHRGLTGDQTAYSVDQVTRFYSYVNMVYPEVKAVFYFDVNMPGEQYDYALNDNSTVRAAYDKAIADNGAYLYEGQTSATGWEELSQTQLTDAGTLRLAAYVSYPGTKDITVEYYVDGALMATLNQAPFYYDLNTAALGAGEHRVHVVATGGQFSRQSAVYTLTVPGTAAQPEPEPEQPSASGFSDVSDDAWYAAPVIWAVENGITAGTSETTFGPNDTCTRSQIITFLYAAAGKPAGASGNPFGDVKEGDWFYDATAWAAANGVEDGDAFAPNDPCTRAMAMEFIWRALGCPEASVTENPFTDVDESASYYEAVLWALGEGVTSGTSETTFGSDNTCTRGQIVTFLYQAFN